MSQRFEAIFYKACIKQLGFYSQYNGKPRRYTELGGESLGVLKIEQYYVESIFLFEEEVWYTISSDIY